MITVVDGDVIELLEGGVAVGAAGAVLYGLAASAYRDYQQAGSESQANALRATTERRLLASRVLGRGALGIAAAGVVMLVMDSRRDSRANAPISLGVADVPGGGDVVKKRSPTGESRRITGQM